MRAVSLAISAASATAPLSFSNVAKYLIMHENNSSSRPSNSRSKSTHNFNTLRCVLTSPPHALASLACATSMGNTCFCFAATQYAAIFSNNSSFVSPSFASASLYNAIAHRTRRLTRSLTLAVTHSITRFIAPPSSPARFAITATTPLTSLSPPSPNSVSACPVSASKTSPRGFALSALANFSASPSSTSLAPSFAVSRASLASSSSARSVARRSVSPWIKTPSVSHAATSAGDAPPSLARSTSGIGAFAGRRSRRSSGSRVRARVAMCRRRSRRVVVGGRSIGAAGSPFY